MSNSIGKDLEDLKWNFTIDQIYLFYRTCCKQQLEDYKMNAIVGANVGVYTSPSHDKSGASSKKRGWEKFIKALTWSSSKKKDKGMGTLGGIQRTLMGVGVPTTEKEKKEQGDQ